MNRRKNVLFSLIIISILLLILEFSLRLSGLGAGSGKQILGFVPRRANPPYRVSETLGWDLIPDWEGSVKSVPVKTNAFGMRDDPFPMEKPEKTIRVLVLGDSFTFGYRVEQDSGYVEQLETLLNREGSDDRYEVMNGGVGGYNTLQERRWLREKGLSFQPDIVLVGFVLNDVMFQGVYRPTDQPWIIQILSRTAIYRTLERFVLSRRVRMNARERAESITRRLLEDSDEIDALWRACFQEITEMRDLARRENIPLAFVLFPWPNQLGRDTHSPTPQDRVIRFLRQSGVPYIDLLPAFRRAGEGLFLEDDSHPSSRGHRIAAREICADLVRSFPRLFHGRGVEEGRSSPMEGLAPSRTPVYIDRG